MKIITQPPTIDAAGSPPKTIEEYVGAVNSRNGNPGVARTKSPRGRSEPGQRPESDEYSVVRYRAPRTDGAGYAAVRVPAIRPERAHRDDVRSFFGDAPVLRFRGGVMPTAAA
ncbi:MAG TPA: cupin [Spirochaetota bacterium]|nr:cupin [Spirochaetota bacterium]